MLECSLSNDSTTPKQQNIAVVCKDCINATSLV